MVALALSCSLPQALYKPLFAAEFHKAETPAAALLGTYWRLLRSLEGTNFPFWKLGEREYLQRQANPYLTGLGSHLKVWPLFVYNEGT